MELESPTQISLVDEASGEVRLKTSSVLYIWWSDHTGGGDSTIVCVCVCVDRKKTSW